MQVDSLDIKISAQANKASASIEDLGRKLNTLSTSLSRINGSGLIGLANGVNRLSNAMQSMKSVGTADFTRLAKNVQKLGQIDTASINRAASAMYQMSKGFAQLNNVSVSESAKQLGDLARGISQLGYKSATQAITNIPKLADAMKDLMRTLSTAPRVSQNLIDMTNALARLARTGASSGRAADALSRSFTSLAPTSGIASKAIKGMQNNFKNLFRSIAPFIGIYEIFSFGKNAVETASALTEVQNVVDVTFGKFKDKIEGFAKVSIPEFGMSELTAKTMASRFQAMGTAMGFTQGKMADMSINLTKLAADMASFYNVEQKDVAEDLASVFTGQTRPLREYGLDLTQATLQEWAMKQGLDANIQSMSQAEKTLLRYQYVMANAGAAQGDFLRTQDTWANQTRILKQNFEQLARVIGGTLINALKPLVKALNTAMQSIISFAKVISDALGKIFGWTYEEDGGGVTIADDFESAAGSADNLAGSTGKAAKNVEKIQKGLRAFDELKVINLPEATAGTGSGGGGGAGGAGSNASGVSGGQWTQTESILKSFESDIDSLYELGQTIGDKLTEAMKSIKWKKVYEKASGFGKGLAKFLSGLISPDLFGNVGKAIASSLKTALKFLNSFGTTFDWTDFGLSIATGINTFFKTFDFALLADTIDAWVQGIWATIKTTIENVKWENVWNGIKDFLSNIDLETVGIVIGAISIKKILSLHLASAALSFIGKTISKKIAQAIASTLGLEIASNAGIGTALMAAGASVGTTFVAGFKALLGSEAAAGALAFINPVIKGITGISSIAGGAFLAISNFVKMLKDGFSWLNEALMVLGIGLTAIGAIILGAPALITGVIAAIAAAVGTIIVVVHENWDAICEWFSGLAEWFNENVITPICNFFKGLWESVSGFFKNLWDDISGIWKDASGWFNTNVIEPVVGFFKGLWTRVQQIFKGLWIIVQAVWKVASEWFNKNVITPVVDFFKGLWEDVSGFFSKLWEDIVAIWKDVSGWFNTNVIEPVVGFFKGLWENVSGYFSDLWKGIKEIWDGVSGWFSDNIITPVVKAFKTACKKISGFFGSLWKGIKKGVAGAMNAVIGGIESAINWLVDGINGIIGGFNDVVDWAAGVIGADWGGVELVPKVSLGRINVEGYELGGFPKEYSLFMAGEHGRAEMLGTVGGQTAVAGGEEITGIRDAVYNTSQQEVELLRQQNQLLQAILEKEYGITRDEIGRNAQSWARDYSRRTGREAYSF